MEVKAKICILNNVSFQLGCRDQFVIVRSVSTPGQRVPLTIEIFAETWSDLLCDSKVANRGHNVLYRILGRTVKILRIYLGADSAAIFCSELVRGRASHQEDIFETFQNALDTFQSLLLAQRLDSTPLLLIQPPSHRLEYHWKLTRSLEISEQRWTKT